MAKIIITIVLGAIAATGVGVWYFSGINTDIQGASEKPIATADSQLPSTANPEQLKGKDSLLSLFRLGKSMECTFAFSADGMKGEGTSFFTDGYVRVDSLYSGDAVGSEPLASYMIQDTNSKLMYMWSSTIGQGMKMTIPDEADTKATSPEIPKTPAGTPPAMDMDTAVQYDCKPWNPDRSVFIPPTDVEFTDISAMQEMMESMQKGTGKTGRPKMVE